ncbi:MAG: hypothetical protein H7322_07700 [Ramlibacter sp.]|nr:hypothetical protein [Ramlibacter sp.]
MKHRAVLALLILAAVIGAAVAIRSPVDEGVRSTVQAGPMTVPVAAPLSRPAASTTTAPPVAKQTQTPAPRGTEPAAWADAHAAFRASANFAALVQSALSEPTVPRLHYAKQTFLYCMAVGADFRRQAAELARFGPQMEACKALDQNYPKRSEFDRALAAAVSRLSEAERATLAVIDSPSSATEVPFAQRLSLANETDDLTLLSWTVTRWAMRGDASFDGRSLSTYEKQAFHHAALLLACEAANDCDKTEVKVFVCRQGGECDGSVRAALQKLERPEVTSRISEAETALKRAIASKNFGAFS